MDDATEAVDYFANANFPRLRQIASKISYRARRRMYERFLHLCAPSIDDRLLDVGVTPDQTLQESNYLERFYPHPDRITATSVEDARALERQFPGLTFVRTVGTTLPFADQTFDVVFCSAVLEHVGDYPAQRALVDEMSRVGTKLFITTPNRWFPVDFHTLVPLIHWLPRHIHQAILVRLGLTFWAQTDNLNLLTAHRLRSLFPPDRDVTIYRARLGGLTSNLIATSGTRDATKGSTP